MRVVTAARMAAIDKETIAGGVPALELMERAGAAVAEAALAMLAELEHDHGHAHGCGACAHDHGDDAADAAPKVLVVCGKGNNGGDGFVVARLALLANLDPRVILLAQPDDLKGDARAYMDAYRRLGGAIQAVEEPDAVAEAVAGLADCAVLIDAMLGTGIQGEVRDPFKSAMQAWPAKPTVAVDLPSGLNADTGETGDFCIRADITVTFQFPKQGFADENAKPYLGRLIVADIGIPEVCSDDDAWADLKARW